MTVGLRELTRELECLWHGAMGHLVGTLDVHLDRGEWPFDLVMIAHTVDPHAQESAQFNTSAVPYVRMWDLERALRHAPHDAHAVSAMLNRRFVLLKGFVETYAKLLEERRFVDERHFVPTVMGGAATTLAETVELEEVCVIAETLAALAPEDAGGNAMRALIALFDGMQEQSRDKLYLLWRLKDMIPMPTFLHLRAQLCGEKPLHEFVRDMVVHTVTDTTTQWSRVIGPMCEEIMLPEERFALHPSLPMAAGAGDGTSQLFLPELIMHERHARVLDACARRIKDIHGTPEDAKDACVRLAELGAAAASLAPLMERIADVEFQGAELHAKTMIDSATLMGGYFSVVAPQAAATLSFIRGALNR